LIRVEGLNTRSEGRIVDHEERCLMIIRSGGLEYIRKRGLRFGKPEVWRPTKIIVIDLRGHVSPDLLLQKISLQRKPRFEIQ
jgi:hypothetical protein